jgi:hypothetical protein
MPLNSTLGKSSCLDITSMQQWNRSQHWYTWPISNIYIYYHTIMIMIMIMIMITIKNNEITCILKT